MRADRRPVRNLLIVAIAATLITVALAISALTWNQAFPPPQGFADRLLVPAVAGILLVVGWAWLYRILRSR
jgi:hypothetical protein